MTKPPRPFAAAVEGRSHESKCTPASERYFSRCEHDDVFDAIQQLSIPAHVGP